MSDNESMFKSILGMILVAIGFALLLIPVIMIISRSTDFYWGIFYLLLFTIPAAVIMFVGTRIMLKPTRVNVAQTVGGNAAQSPSCPNCGIKYPPGTEFCSKCGSKLVKP